MNDGPPWDKVIDGLHDVRKSVEASTSAIVTKLDMMAKFAGGPQAQQANALLPGGSSATAGQTQMPAGHIPGSGATQPAGGTPPGAPPSGGGGGGGGGGTPPSQPPHVNPPGPPAGSTTSTQGGLGGLRSRIGANIQANGGGVRGALGSGLNGLRGQGGATALALASELFRGYKSETEKAARYQGMEGPGQVQRKAGMFGSAGLGDFGGLGELSEERMYAATHNQLWNPNGFSGDEAAQAFVDVTSLGYNNNANKRTGRTRAQVLEFMNSNKSRLGMDENESMDVMNEAVRNPTASLSSLREALDGVSEAAGNAGVNARLARANFLTLFHGLTMQGAGAGATRLAAAQSGALAHLGAAYQDIDTSGQYDEGMQYRVAAASGMTPGAYQNLMRNSPDKAQALVDQMSGQAIDNMIGPGERKFIQDTAASVGGRDALLNDPALIQEVANQWANRFQPDMNTLRKAIQSTQNVPLTNNDVPVWVVKYVMKITAADIKDQTTGKGGAVVTGKDGKQTYLDGGGAVGGDDKGALAAAGSGNTGQEATAKGGKHLDKAQQAYYDVLHRKGVQPGRHEPMIEKLLNMKGHANMEVLVSAKGGMRRMSLDEAIKNFPDEVASGKISFLSGKDDKGNDLMGKSAMEVTGLKGDDRSVLGEEQSDKGAKVGTKFDANDKRYKDYQKKLDEKVKEGKDDGSGATKIEIADSAKWLIKLAPKGTQTGSDASTGTQPNPSKGIIGDLRMAASDALGHIPWVG